MLVGTPPEERFDRLTRLAQKAFGVPVAAITLVDKDRVWAKSCAGIPAGDLDTTCRSAEISLSSAVRNICSARGVTLSGTSSRNRLS